MKQISEAVKAYRLENGLTQDDLANEFNASRSSIQSIERGNCEKISDNFLNRLLSFIGFGKKITTKKVRILEDA